MIEIILYFCFAYLLGSLPFGFWAGKVLKKVDIREHGSGNVGATNAFRVLGWRIGIPVLILDMLKGFVAVQAGTLYELPHWSVVVAGIVAIAGHNWTIFLRFKGGKGVATSAGVFCALVPGAFLAALCSFLLALLLTRYISVGSMLGAVVLACTVSVQFFTSEDNQPGALVLGISYLATIFIFIRHRSNIGRLFRGKENRFALRSSKHSSE